MNNFIQNILIITCIVCFTVVTIPAKASAKFLFRASPKPLTPKIMKGGLSKFKMNPKSRIGRERYFADNIKTAVKEKPRAKNFILFKKSRTFKNKIIDTTRMTPSRLKRISGVKDMRGTIKKGIIGPKLGHKIGNYAKRNNLIIVEI